MTRPRDAPESCQSRPAISISLRCISTVFFLSCICVCCRCVARRLRRTDDDLCDLIFTDVVGRVAKQLLRLAQRFGSQDDGGMRVHHGLTREELAQLIESTRETVNKVMKDFTVRGWISMAGKSVLIRGSEHLRRRART